MSIYEFIDTIDAIDAETSILLPSEAVAIDDVYLEGEVEGYRTLYTSGRESLEKQLETKEIGSADGLHLLGLKYPERLITIGFQIIAEDSYSFRNSFNQLAKILSTKKAKFVFNDEPDKFFVGVPLLNAEVDKGRNSVIGEWQIFCTDPFKYSVEEKCVEMVTQDGANVLVTSNDGTYKTYPRFEVEFPDDSGATDGKNADCGYVMFAKNGTEYSLQCGDDKEEDTSSGTESIVDKEFLSDRTGFTDDITMQVNRIITGDNAGTFQNGGATKLAVNKGIMLDHSGTSGYFGNCSGFQGATVKHLFKRPLTGAFELDFKHCFSRSIADANARKTHGLFSVALLTANEQDPKMIYTIDDSGYIASQNLSSSDEYTNVKAFDHFGALGFAETQKGSSRWEDHKTNRGNVVSGPTGHGGIRSWQTFIDYVFVGETESTYTIKVFYVGLYLCYHKGVSIIRPYCVLKKDGAVVAESAQSTSSTRWHEPWSSDRLIGTHDIVFTKGNTETTHTITASCVKSARYYQGTSTITLNFKVKPKGAISGAKLSDNIIKRYKQDGKWITTFDLRSYDGSGKSLITGVSDSAVPITGVAFTFGNKYLNQGGNWVESPPLEENYLHSVKVISGDIDKANTFGGKDKLDIDVSTMKIKLNSADKMSLGDITNDWENFYLDVGQNVITCQWSDWVDSEYRPIVKMYYRERFL